jgi:hypothetical protein
VYELLGKCHRLSSSVLLGKTRRKGSASEL